MARGPRPKVPVIVGRTLTDVKAYEKVILQKCENAEFGLTSPFAEPVRSLCTDILNDPDRLGSLASLIAACLMEENRMRASAQFLSSLAGSDENGDHLVTANTISSFAANPATNSWTYVYYYLRIVMILLREEHPCTKHHVFGAILAGCGDIEAFGRVFRTASNLPSKSEIRLSSIAAAGGDLYRLINRAGGDIRPADILKLKGSRAFEDVTYSTRASETPEPFLCVRPSMKHDHLLLSYMQFSAVRETLEGAPGGRMPREEGVYIYNELYIGDSTGRLEDKLVSTGYVVPSGSNVFILNHSVANDGFMFMTFAGGEIFNLEKEPVLRGLVLGLNRGGNFNPIVSRVALIRRPGADLRLGQVPVADFERAMMEGERPEIARITLDYLYDPKGGEIRSGGEADGWTYYDDVELFLDDSCDGVASIVLRRPLMAPTPEER